MQLRLLGSLGLLCFFGIACSWLAVGAGAVAGSLVLATDKYEQPQPVSDVLRSIDAASLTVQRDLINCTNCGGVNAAVGDIAGNMYYYQYMDSHLQNFIQAVNVSTGRLVSTTSVGYTELSNPVFDYALTGTIIAAYFGLQTNLVSYNVLNGNIKALSAFPPQWEIVADCAAYAPSWSSRAPTYFTLFVNRAQILLYTATLVTPVQWTTTPIDTMLSSMVYYQPSNGSVASLLAYQYINSQAWLVSVSPITATIRPVFQLPAIIGSLGGVALDPKRVILFVLLYRLQQHQQPVATDDHSASGVDVGGGVSEQYSIAVYDIAGGILSGETPLPCPSDWLVLFPSA